MAASTGAGPGAARPGDEAWADLYWLPLGAGGHCVRWNGRLYEWLAARYEQRPPRDLYHSALQLRLAGTTYAVEMGPQRDRLGAGTVRS